MTGENRFPEELLLDEPDRGQRLIREFYQHYADITKTPNYYTEMGPQHEKIKTTFYRRWLERNSHDQRSLGLDVGCRGGVLVGMVGLIRWIGVDIDGAALEVAREAGLACAEMDFTSAINFQNASFDAVMMTEVLEHLPYPAITVPRGASNFEKEPRQRLRRLGSARLSSASALEVDARQTALRRTTACSSFFFQGARPATQILFRQCPVSTTERHGAAPSPLETPLQPVCSRYCLGGSFTQSKAGLLEYKGKVLSY